MAVVFAESPSVKIRVHFSDSAVPALFASSNFGMESRTTFLPSVLESDFFSFASAIAKSESTNPSFNIFFVKSSVKENLLPNSETRVVCLSLVCELNVGFSMILLINTNNESFTYCGLTVMFLCFA